MAEHIISASQFDVDRLEEMFDRADYMRDVTQTRPGRAELMSWYLGETAATLFYEPSTRTRLSFEAAAQGLGFKVVSTENAKEFSSAAKGETIEDTIRTVACYAGAIIMRHGETGAAARAAAVSPVPIINAGDGKGEHPTQALLDMYTIKQEKQRLDSLHVVIGGDLAHGRTARSLAQLLALYPGNEITFVSTPELQIGDDITRLLDQKGLPYVKTSEMKPAIAEADVIYWTRLQKERLTDPTLEAGFTIDKATLDAMAKDAIIMHPLPRVGEIHESVDSDPRAAYFRQVKNGLYIRMALIDQLFSDNR